MGKRIKLMILSAALISLGHGVYGQSTQNHPPEPNKNMSDDPRKGPCGQGNGGGNSPNIPPPVGLCLPINDYLLPLLICGILFGAYKVRSIEQQF